MIINTLIETLEVIVPINSFSRTFRVEIFSSDGKFSFQVSERIAFESCLTKGAFTPNPSWTYAFRLIDRSDADSHESARDLALKKVEINTSSVGS